MVTCSFSAFASGASADFTLVIRAGDTSSITNTATVTTDSFDSNPNNNTASVTTTVNARADLGVTNTGPATATAGTNLSYTVTVTNAGPSIAADAGSASRAFAPAAIVTLTDVLPPNTTFVLRNQTAGPSFSCSTPAVGLAGTITCTLATLAPSGSAIFRDRVAAGAFDARRRQRVEHGHCQHGHQRFKPREQLVGDHRHRHGQRRRERHQDRTAHRWRQASTR
jgi:hypothetical protein